MNDIPCFRYYHTIIKKQSVTKLPSFNTDSCSIAVNQVMITSLAGLNPASPFVQMKAEGF
jgi:hypothetical protein